MAERLIAPDLQSGGPPRLSKGRKGPVGSNPTTSSTKRSRLAAANSGQLLDHQPRDCPPEAMIVDTNIAISVGTFYPLQGQFRIMDCPVSIFPVPQSRAQSELDQPA